LPFSNYLLKKPCFSTLSILCSWIVYEVGRSNNPAVRGHAMAHDYLNKRWGMDKWGYVVNETLAHLLTLWFFWIALRKIIRQWFHDPGYQLPYLNLKSLSQTYFDPAIDTALSNEYALDPIIGQTIQYFPVTLFKGSQLLKNIKFENSLGFNFHSSNGKMVLTLPSFAWKWAFSDRAVLQSGFKFILNLMLLLMVIKKRLHLEQDPELIRLYTRQAAPASAYNTLLANSFNDIMSSKVYYDMKLNSTRFTREQFIEELWSMAKKKSGMELINELQYLSVLTGVLGMKPSKTAIIIPTATDTSEQVVIYLPVNLIKMRRLVGAIQDILEESNIPVIYRNWPNMQPGVPLLRSVMDAV